MSRKGDRWDDAITESFFHTLKTKLIYKMSYQTKGETKQNVFQYLEVYYNRKRRIPVWIIKRHMNLKIRCGMCIRTCPKK